MPVNCVAIGCTNYYYGKGNSSFFRFPSERTYPGRRAAWIAAVKRVNPDGTPWQPNRHSRICGAHFITGRPSIFKDHPDYVPTVFAYSEAGSAGARDRVTAVTAVQEQKRDAVSEEKAMSDLGGKRADGEKHSNAALTKDQRGPSMNVKRLKKTVAPSRNLQGSPAVSAKGGPAHRAKQQDTKRASKRRRPLNQEGDGEGAPPNQVVSVYVMDEVCEDPVSAMVQAECVQGRTVYSGTPSRTRKLPSAPVSLSDREQSIASLLASMSTDCFATADIGVQAGTAKETKATQVAVRLTREKTVQVGLPLPNRPTEDKAVLVNTEVFIPKFVDNLNDRNVRYFTGLPSLKFLKALALCYQNTQPVSARRHFNCVERIVLVLMKLRHNYNNALLTALFNCSVSSCTIMAAQAIPVLAEIFRPLVYLPPREETTKSTPKFFKELSNVRVIIGCMQIPLSQPDSLSAAFHSHSVDRKELTAKYLIAVTTSGLIAHVSRGYGGRTSDGEVFERSGLIELLDAGSDAIMADPSFAIDELCEGRDIEVVRPTRRIYPKRREGDAPTQTYQILSTRVHVERVAHVVKQFKILSAGVPQTMVGGLDEIMIVAAGIANLSDPMIGPQFFV